MKKKHTTTTLIDYLGWIGVVLILGSYGLLALGILHGNSASYHLLVLAGSAFVAALSYKKRIFQPAVLNTIFAVFATIALIRIIFIAY